MPAANVKLHGSDGSAIVRTNRGANDAASWTPDSEAGDDIANNTFDGRDWEDVLVVVKFRGSLDGTEAVTVTPIVAVPDTTTGNVNGRRWVTRDAIVFAASGHLKSDLFLCDGHDVSFRISALTLGTATGVDVMVSGGMNRRLRSGA